MTHLNGTAVAEPAAKPCPIQWTPEQRARLDARRALEARYPIAFAQWNATEEVESCQAACADAMEALLDALATGQDAEIWPDAGVCSGEPLTRAEFYDAIRTAAWNRRDAHRELVRTCHATVLRTFSPFPEER